MTKKKAKKKGSGLRIGLTITLILLIILGAAGVGVYSWYEKGMKEYEGIFLPGTSINGEDVSGKTPGEYVAEQIAAHRVGTFTVYETDGAEETIALTDIISEVTFATDPADFLSEDELKQWYKAIRETRSFEDEISVVYDEELLREQVHQLAAISGENIREPQDAYFTKTETGFAIIPEENGTEVEEEKVYALIHDAIFSGESSVDLVEAGCYKQAKITKDDPSLVALMEKYEAMLGIVITMDMTNATEVIDESVYGPWIEFDGTDFYYNEGKVESYVNKLSVDYWTYQTKRWFKTHDGLTIEVGGSERDTYGFWLNTDLTKTRILNALATGESQNIEAFWRVNALTRNQENGDIGGTYIEISIGQQHLWYCRGYEVVFETDITTGTQSDPERQTPTGVFCILSKLEDHTMSGTYGTQFCHEFMAFDWTGCAIHDAWWRSSFGGDIYLNNGSHGCVNVPADAMKELFDMVYTATPVIIY